MVDPFGLAESDTAPNLGNAMEFPNDAGKYWAPDPAVSWQDVGAGLWGMASDVATGPIAAPNAAIEAVIHASSAAAKNQLGDYLKQAYISSTPLDSLRPAFPQLAATSASGISGAGDAANAKGLLASAAGPSPARGVPQQGIRVTQNGLDIAAKHLAQFGEHGPNQAMLARLQSALGGRVTGAEANFYLHEISEATMMGRGMSYDAAHAAALEKYGVSPYSLYHPEVIQQLPARRRSAAVELSVPRGPKTSYALLGGEIVDAGPASRRSARGPPRTRPSRARSTASRH